MSPGFHRRPLGFFPTPLHALPRLSEWLGGPEIWIKRDDQTGLALGGNKTRKLEYLVGEAIAAGADTLLTGGADQSNHCRQTAAAAAACGLDCDLVLGGSPPELAGGNLLLDELLGARVHWAGARRRGEDIPHVAAELERAGHVPAVIPYGGSNDTGAAGFVEAVRELGEQQAALDRRFSHVVFASSSGGTHAGLMVGRACYEHDFALVGIQIEKPPQDETPYPQTVADLASRTAQRLGHEARFSARDPDLRTAYLGGGYGVVGDAEREAIRMTARSEGILLDPVYTGRAMAGLIDRVRQGEFESGGRVLFWHSGGTPALWAHARDLLRG